MPFTTATDGVEIYYEVHGPTAAPEDAAVETLVFASGFMGIADIWQHQVAAFSAEYRCVVRDTRGYGRSGKPEDLAQYSVEIFAEEWGAVLDAAGVTGPVTFITHSMGCNIATAFTLAYPARVKGIVMTGAYVSGPHYVARGLTADALFEGNCAPSKSVQFYMNFGLPQSIAIEAAKWPNFARRGAAQALVAYNPEPRYAEIKVPVLILQGDSDVVGPADPFATDLQAALVNARDGAALVLLQGANHFPQVESPGPFNKHVSAFLNKIRA